MEEIFGELIIGFIFEYIFRYIGASIKFIFQFRKKKYSEILREEGNSGLAAMIFILGVFSISIGIIYKNSLYCKPN